MGGPVGPKPSKKRWKAVDKSWAAKIHPRIDVKALTTGVEEWLPYRLGRLPGHFGDGGMPVHELPAAELPQERPGTVGSGPGVYERLMLAELVQQSIPARDVIAPKQTAHGLVDLCDRLAVAGVEQCVSVSKEVLAFPRHGGEAGEPAHVIGRDALQVSGLATVLLPIVLRRLLGAWDRLRAETVRGQQEHVVVAEQHLDTSASLGSLFLQTHDELNGAYAVRAMIDEVAHEPEGALATAPGRVLVRAHQFRRAQQTAQLLELTVDVSDDVDRAHHFPHESETGFLALARHDTSRAPHAKCQAPRRSHGRYSRGRSCAGPLPCSRAGAARP